MSDKPPPVNRIPHESLTDNTVSSWSLPSMLSSVPTGNPNIRNAPGSAGSSSGRVSKESIDVVAKDELPKSLKAEDLKIIAEEAHKEGYSEGYAEGLRKGTEQGLKKGTQQGKDQAYKETKKEMLDIQNRLRSIATQLFEPMRSQDDALEKTLVDMTVYFAQSLIDSELSQSPHVLYGIVKKALLSIPVGASDISVKLNSNDANLLESLVPEGDRSWSVIRDESIKSGGCVVESDVSLVNYSVEHRMQKFLDEAISGGDISSSQVSEIGSWPSSSDKVKDDIRTPADTINESKLTEDKTLEEELVDLDPAEADSVDVDPVDDDLIEGEFKEGTFADEGKKRGEGNNKKEDLVKGEAINMSLSHDSSSKSESHDVSVTQISEAQRSDDAEE